MAELGGTTTQSGIHYQNSIAALYLGRLLDSRPRTSSERVIEVRVEAPEHVDDIVVRHADGSCTYIQAKEALSLVSEEWNKLWIHFEAQVKESRAEKFRIIIAMGAISRGIEQLNELCDRAKGKKNYEEWIDSLSDALRVVANKIINALPEKTAQAAYELVRYVEVWIWPLNMIERDLIPLWIPPSTLPTETLYDLLRGKVGGKARIRGIFHTYQLLDELCNENRIEVYDVPSWGIDAYIQAIRTELEILSVPGTRLRGPISELFFWMPLHDRAKDNVHLDFEDEDPRWRWDCKREIIDLRNYPYGTINRAVIDAGAGFGKTTMLRAIAYNLSFGVRIPVFISLDALAASDMSVLEYLNSKINTEYSVSIDWERLCESGRAVILFDGLDELSTVDRTSVSNIIIKFAARFQKSAFLLTVRDSSALTIPLGLPILALDRLDEFTIRKFADSYARHGSRLSADSLTNHLRRYPDLGHLLRIPLFLALVLASISPEDDLPRSRSEILEHYLSLLFSPERHKAIVIPLCAIGDLREAAELLAWRGLESGGIGLTEIGANRLLRGQGLKEQSDIYIDRLVQVGVLSRVSARLQFTFPIIQEYLAACWMVTNIPKEIGPRFDSIRNRPWAQALQFAIEMHPDANAIISNQLNSPDDAFNTTLRLIARCIVNGAKVSADVRRLVGDYLSDAWPSEACSIRQSIGYLLVDGFLEFLPPKAVKHISNWALHYGGAEIVVAKSSPAFTLEILKKYISKDLHLHPFLHGWQAAVDEIAEEALDLYLERVRDKRTTKKELDSLSSLIESLPASRLRADRWNEIASDVTLPSIIRLAGYQLGPHPIHLSAWTIINDVIRLVELDNENSTNYYAYKLYWHMQDAEVKFMQMINDISVSEKRVRLVLEALMRSEMQNEAKREILIRVMSESNPSKNIHFLMLLCLATWGDEEAERKSIPMLLEQDLDNLNSWLCQANKFCETTIRDAAKILSSRSFDAKQLLQLIGSADFGLSYKTDANSFNAVAGNEPWVHPARGDMLSYLCVNLNADESIDALMIKSKMGENGACEKLITEMRRLVTSFQGFMPFDDDQNIYTILYHLELQNTSVPLDLLFQIIDKSSSNAGNRAVDWIVRSGDDKVVLKLVECYNSREQDFVREEIFSALETLAGRYGKRFIRNGTKLVIEEHV
jgi:hypothetical protein